MPIEDLLFEAQHLRRHIPSKIELQTLRRLLEGRDQRLGERIPDLALNKWRHARREIARNMCCDIRPEKQLLQLGWDSALEDIGDTLGDLVAQSILDLVLRDSLESWQNGVLDFRLDSLLDDTCGVLSELGRDELENRLLARKVCFLVRTTKFVDALF